MRLITYLRTKASRALPVVVAALFLAGCPSLKTSTNSIQGEIAEKSPYYLQQVEQSSGDAKVNWQLLAVRALITENNTKQAFDILQKLPNILPIPQDQERQLLRAELAVKRQDNKDAFLWLKNIKVPDLSNVQKARYYQVQIMANQGKDPLAQLRAYINIEPLVSDKEHPNVIDQTWNLLTQFTPATLNTLVINADENTLSSWLELLQAYQNNKADRQMLESAIKDWQNRYASHPASKVLPSQLSRALSFQKSSNASIALLLPLSGTGKQFGPTIQDGFNAAKSLSKAASQVKVYDTGAKPLAELLTQAEQEGATIIVGPLLKKDVEQLAASPSTLTILALNKPEKVTDRLNVCYFALSPEDEAKDAARHIFAQGKKSPLIIAPRGDLGTRAAKAFAEQWSTTGSGAAQVQYFGKLGDLKDAIAGGGGMRLQGQPITLASGITGAPAGAVDAIYIIATQPELALIKPMLDISKASASASLYASSRSYQAGSGPDFRFEMEGVQFSEIPILVGLSPAINQQAGTKYSNDYSQLRLYGLGADAWELASHFSEMRQQPDFQVAGATGILTADKNCVINRQLPWIQYRQGQLVPVK
ncbi:penicillin-binding protein activator [Budvicia diplopodorum]|uniref:penicillin-binding protein activator n=1 Tax=Budvicia diplopodorum TaxID=1119056 RepID=UPI00135B3B41|nr:penicillin-binding protein activator [Budvicia diplopodorum]